MALNGSAQRFSALAPPRGPGPSSWMLRHTAAARTLVQTSEATRHASRTKCTMSIPIKAAGLVAYRAAGTSRRRYSSKADEGKASAAGPAAVWPDNVGQVRFSSSGSGTESQSAQGHSEAQSRSATQPPRIQDEKRGDDDENVKSKSSDVGSAKLAERADYRRKRDNRSAVEAWRAKKEAKQQKELRIAMKELRDLEQDQLEEHQEEDEDGVSLSSQGDSSAASTDYATRYKKNAKASPGSRSFEKAKDKARRILSELELKNIGPNDKDSVLDTLDKRGMLHQVSAPNSLREHLQQEDRCIYLGIDPTADSLHVGNLLPLMAAIYFLKEGHKVVLLIGGATGRIGDPSGRETERQSLSDEIILENNDKITRQISSFMQAAIDEVCQDAGADMRERWEIVDNREWYKEMNVLHFLREVGTFARVNTMLARESVKSRMTPNAQDGVNKSSGTAKGEQGISFTEFSYQLLQAHDYHVLNTGPWKCSVQLGGSDQMGNIMAGIDLIRRRNLARKVERQEAAKKEGKSKSDFGPRDEAPIPAYGLTLPLLTTASGAKFGKSAGNAIWLDAGKTSHYDFYQFFYRSRDDEVETYLRCLTFLSHESIERVMEHQRESPSERIAQTVLARTLTRLHRGQDALEAAEEISLILHEVGAEDLTRERVNAAFPLNDASKILCRRDPEKFLGLNIRDALVDVGLTLTRGEGRRAVDAGSIYINDKRLTTYLHVMTHVDLIGLQRIMLITHGKQEHRIVYLYNQSMSDKVSHPVVQERRARGKLLRRQLQKKQPRE